MKEKSCDNCKHLVHLHDENRWECDIHGSGFCGEKEWEAVE